jgi:isoleucyl-tRNA synthetase
MNSSETETRIKELELELSILKSDMVEETLQKEILFSQTSEKYNKASDITDAAILHQKAEKQLKTRRNKACLVSTATEIDTLKLIHELQVHQIELEMQNEELILAKQKAEFAQKQAEFAQKQAEFAQVQEKLAKEKYADLYNFAPLGYLTLTKDGEIIESGLVHKKLIYCKI